MLDEFTQKDLEILRNTLANFWHNDCIIESIEVIDVPVPMFEIKLTLYEKISVGLFYDRGTMDIGIKQDGKPVGADDEYIILQDYSDKKVHRGFDVMQPEVMQHNFSVLDEVAKQLAFGK